LAVYRAGIASAEDPAYVVRQQRGRVAATGRQPAVTR